MQLNIPVLALCLLGTAILCSAQNSTDSPTSSTIINTNITSQSPDTGAPTSPGPSTTPGPSTAPGPSTTPGPSTAPGTSTATTQTGPNTETPVSATTESVGGSGSDELSSGAIAGIAIGSIAGVAALGGGIFGALKYTGKI